MSAFSIEIGNTPLSNDINNSSSSSVDLDYITTISITGTTANFNTVTATGIIADNIGVTNIISDDIITTTMASNDIITTTMSSDDIITTTILVDTITVSSLDTGNQLGNMSAEHIQIGQQWIGQTDQLVLTEDTAVKPTTNTWTVPSDERIKTNIIDADLNECLDTICSLQLREYNFKPEYSHSHKIVSQTPFWGLIAQELESVAPFCVHTKTGIHKWCQCPDGGKGKHENNCSPLIVEDLKIINISELGMAVYGAIKSLKQKNDELSARLDYVDYILKENHLLPI